MDFSSSFASSMEESFSRINSLIDSKLSAQGNVSQDATNFSFSGDSHPVPVRYSLGTERQDHSQSNPQQDLGSGGEAVEPVQGQGDIFPELHSWVEGLRTAGVRIPQPILNLARSASLGGGEPVEGAIPFFSVAQPSEAPPVMSSGSQGVTSGLSHSQGLGPASGWFDEPVNVGASSSSASASAPRVSFSIPLTVGEEEMETASLSGEVSSLRMLRAGSAVCLCSFV